MIYASEGHCTAETGTVFEHANCYIGAGLRVLPLQRPVHSGDRLVCSCGKPDCRSSAKHPVGRLTPNGLKDATCEPVVIDRWFGETGWNIGIVTGCVSGIFAIDIDPRHGGHTSLAALEQEHGLLPPTWRFLTGGGGQHILFRHPGGTVPNSAGKVALGIDVRGDGGYIVAPPSQHMSGRPYAVSADHHPGITALADPPQWLLAMVRREASSKPVTRSKAASREEWHGRLASDVGEGGRNQAIAQLSGLLLGRKIDPHTCLELVLAFNKARCHPPLTDEEVALTVASIAKRELAGRKNRMAAHG